MEAYEELERKFGEWMGYEPNQMVAVSSGTSALHLALEARNDLSGYKVAMSDFNMIACPRSVSLAASAPKFFDCSGDLNLDPTKLAYSPIIKGIMAAHVYGRACDMEAIHKFAAKEGLYVLEDCSEIHGYRSDPRSYAACWSFYKNKIVAGEEGGMIAFQDKDLAHYARQLRSLGFTEEHNYTHHPRGINARMSNCHARLILRSLYGVNYNLVARRQVEHWYNELIPIEWHRKANRKSVWVYDLQLPGEPKSHSLQNYVVKRLNDQGIAARHGFKCCSLQKEYTGLVNPPTPVAFAESMRVIYLPVAPEMPKERIRFIAGELVAAVEAYRSPAVDCA